MSLLMSLHMSLLMSLKMFLQISSLYSYPYRYWWFHLYGLDGLIALSFHHTDSFHVAGPPTPSTDIEDEGGALSIGIDSHPSVPASVSFLSPGLLELGLWVLIFNLIAPFTCYFVIKCLLRIKALRGCFNAALSFPLCFSVISAGDEAPLSTTPNDSFRGLEICVRCRKTITHGMTAFGCSWSNCFAHFFVHSDLFTREFDLLHKKIVIFLCV